MKYAVIGAGGTGGMIGFYMTKAGKDVTLIARGEHLAKMQKELPELLVTDGCIYVSANIKEPGVLLQHGKILRVVFGTRDKEDFREILREIAEDLCDYGIEGVLSENIRRDALEKFSYVSPIGAAGLYFDAVARDFQREGEPRETFKAMIREIAALAEAMGIPFEKDMVEANLKILSNLVPEATTSMQRDVRPAKIQKSTGWSMRLCGWEPSTASRSRCIRKWRRNCVG